MSNIIKRCFELFKKTRQLQYKNKKEQLNKLLKTRTTKTKYL